MSKPLPLLKPTSTADRVATLLRERILATPEGDYLGSEGDLALEIGVSLPTLRQASRMLEYEELLTIKPGKGGGYFSRRPSIETAIQSASQFLSTKDLITNDQLMDCADPILITIVEKAVKCKDPALLAELQAFVETQRAASDRLLPPDESFKVSIQMTILLGRMSGNLLLELFSRILWNEVSISRSNGAWAEMQDVLKNNHRTRLRVAEAVLEKDREKAIKAWKARSKFLRNWPQRTDTAGQ